MPIVSPTEVAYNFDRPYEDLPPISLPVKIIDPQFGEMIYGTSLSSIPAFAAENWKLKIYPDFDGVDPEGISSTFLADNYRYFIDLGDGTLSTDLTAEHYYKYPGEYKVTLVAVDSATNFYVGLQQPVIKVSNVISDVLFLNYVNDNNTTTGVSGNMIRNSRFENPARLTRFNSYQTWPTVSANGGYTVNLTVSGNRSEFVSPSSYYSDTYAHLKKYSGFVQVQADGQGRLVDSIKTTNDLIYGKVNKNFPILGPYFFYPEPRVDTVLLGTSGIAEFYYYED